MRWRVVKMGRALFDALHAYGVAITIATITKQTVTLQDEGNVYELTCSITTLPASSPELLDQILPLPTEEQLLLPVEERSEFLAVTILDGLLAALLTIPGLSYATNVHDLCTAQRFKPDSIANGLQKASQKTQQWKKWLFQTAQDATNWAVEMLDDYTWQAPVAPILSTGRSRRDLHILMTIDPSFAYSFRQPINTQNMMDMSNVAIHGTAYATLLTFIGAARFLRAQSASAPAIVFTLPLLFSGVIHAQTTLPLLSSAYDVSSDLAIMQQWLNIFTTSLLPDASWCSLAYQVFQKQKRQQPLSYESGQLHFSWLDQIVQGAGMEVLTFWQRRLQYGTPDEQEPLIELLKQRRVEGWYNHLLQQTSAVLISPDSKLRRYHFEEVRNITIMLESNSSHPLRAVLDRDKEGTVCFGKALHQLGRYNSALLRDFWELLEPISTEEELFPVLRSIVAECDLAKQKWRYISVPSKNDFTLLLDDIHRHGVRKIVGVLQILSAVHYQASDDWKKHELSTLIRLFLWLATQVPVSQVQDSPPNDESTEGQFIADEQLLLLSEDDPSEENADEAE